MDSRHGEQQALMNCERMEQLRLGEYHRNLRLGHQERNQGRQYLQTEVAALQNMNTVQTQELNAQRGMVKSLMLHMEQPVGK
eukprot:8959843-Prorocentrum_lima.AAC.1